MPHGTLEVIVVEAKNLKSSLMDKTDPYVVLTVGGKKQKTTVKNNAGKQAEWNEKFQFDIFDGVSEMYVEVWDDDAGKDDLRGSKVIDLNNAFDKKTVDASFSLTHHDKHAGDIKLVIYFNPRK
jgi:Ca2+-dependent lipid-binding protein